MVENFHNAYGFFIVWRNGPQLSKLLKINFYAQISLHPMPCFAVKSFFDTFWFLAVMQVQNGEIVILNCPKLTGWLIFMSSLGRYPDWQSIIIRTPPNSFSKMSKTGINHKNPLYIRYNLKIRYIKKVKNRF